MTNQTRTFWQVVNDATGQKFQIFEPNRKADSRCHVICRRIFVCILIVAVILLSSIIFAIYRPSSPVPNICHSNECLRSATAFQQYMDHSVDPCDDFYSYVCGKWAKEHPRPEERKTHNWYNERQIRVNRIIRDHLETNISRSDPKPVAQAKQMYRACLISQEVMNITGFKVVQKYLKEFGLPMVPTLLNSTRTSQRRFKFDWVSSVAKIQRKLGLNVIIGFDIEEDHLNRDRNRLTLKYGYSPQKLEFPIYEWSKLHPKGHTLKLKENESEESDTDEDAEDYEEDEESVPEELGEGIEGLVQLINPTINTSNMKSNFVTLAKEFLAFNEELPAVDDKSDDEEPAYYTAAELQNITDSHIVPQKPYPVWQHYLDVLFADLPDIKPAVDEQLQIEPRNVEFLGNLINVVSKQSPELIELYIWVRVTNFLISHSFNELETEEDCVENVHKLMGLAVSYAIADKNFLKETKPRVEQMLNDIRSEFDQMVLETDWMDAYTKAASVEKSKAMESLIGFPEWILDVDKLEGHYRGLQIDQFHHFGNWVNALQLLNMIKLQSWRMENHNIWNTDPTDVNAFNHLYRNTISIPVAMIQYPFFYLGLEALNYGALGSTLGHELTHGFDNSGRHYDKFGNYKQWWSNHSLQEYDKRASCLVEQYEKYRVPEANSYVNGTLTLGENIADNGGAREAYRAYQAYVKRNGPEPLLPGFTNYTHEQLFFISLGNECGTNSLLDVGILMRDEHSPPKFRVVGAVSNMKEFSEAFKCPRGSKMNPEKKCRVW